MPDLILGEALRSVDERYRISLPPELIAGVLGGDNRAVLAKERQGCLSLWNPGTWQAHLEEGVRLVREKIEAGRLAARAEEVQMLGRLLSTRHTELQIRGRGRMAVPEGFREFLGVSPGDEAMIVGAAICVEIWHPEKWQQYIAATIPDFRNLIDRLVG